MAKPPTLIEEVANSLDDSTVTFGHLIISKQVIQLRNVSSTKAITLFDYELRFDLIIYFQKFCAWTFSMRNISLKVYLRAIIGNCLNSIHLKIVGRQVIVIIKGDVEVSIGIVYNLLGRFFLENLVISFLMRSSGCQVLKLKMQSYHLIAGIF